MRNHEEQQDLPDHKTQEQLELERRQREFAEEQLRRQREAMGFG